MKQMIILLTALLFNLPILTTAHAAEQTKQENDRAAQSTQKFSCSTVARYCKDMGSCEEAEFALEQCGMSKLDRDKDGIPCENVCG